MSKKYSGFTLVEMLIVMGIIIILTVVGITAGRFAINRANDVAHRNAVDQIVTSLQAYYTDKREYPEFCDETGTTACTVALLVGDNETEGYLVPYIDKGAFDGGSKSTYYYKVGGDGGNQSFLTCVTLRGFGSEMFTGGDTPTLTRDDVGVYCNVTGISDETIYGGLVTQKELTAADEAALSAIAADTGSDWDNGWQTAE